MLEATTDRRNLTIRSISALFFVPAILGLVAVGDWAILVLVLLITGRCAWELFAICTAAGIRPDRNVGLVLVLCLGVYVYLHGTNGLEGFLMLAALLTLAAALRQGTDGFTTNALITLGALLYIGLLGSAPLLIVHAAGPERQGDAGYLLGLIFLCIWLADSAAYLVGRRWGKKKLCPTISPGKTIVGLGAGILGGLLPGLSYKFVPFISPGALVGLLLLSALAGQLGDLTESALKRDLGVKDAPVLIPGHGGALDRFDSYFFSFPVAYLYLIAIGYL